MVVKIKQKLKWASKLAEKKRGGIGRHQKATIIDRRRFVN